MISRLDRLVDAASADLPEQYRAAAHEWVRLDARARQLETGKEVALLKRVRALSSEKGISMAAAEREVRLTQEWQDIENERDLARTQANASEVDKDYLRMKFAQWHVMRSQEELAA